MNKTNIELWIIKEELLTYKKRIELIPEKANHEIVRTILNEFRLFAKESYPIGNTQIRSEIRFYFAVLYEKYLYFRKSMDSICEAIDLDPDNKDYHSFKQKLMERIHRNLIKYNQNKLFDLDVFKRSIFKYLEKPEMINETNLLQVLNLVKTRMTDEELQNFLTQVNRKKQTLYII